MSLELAWLPEVPAWRELLEATRKLSPEAAFTGFQRLANSRMDFVRAGQLDRAIQRYIVLHGAPKNTQVVRLALLGTGTLTHLLPGIRLGALRRGVLLEVYVGSYGMYRQELADNDSGLYRFRPEIVCFSFDAQHLVPTGGRSPQDTLNTLQYCWRTAQNAFQCAVVQQTGLHRLPTLMGNNEEQLRESPANLLREVNELMRAHAVEHRVSLLAVDRWSSVDGTSVWFDAALWFSAKQEVHPRASVLYGEQLGRLVGAFRGKSAKCLVLDLDNTLWGGVIGDDGLEGIALGQGSPTGEAFIAFQQYVLQLAKRGVVLAVCSKNDHANAIAPFESHPEMCLKYTDIACFVANWQDKAANLRHISETLNLPLDALVFIDDNPAERRLIRNELPMVSVPELPEDPAAYVTCLADAGYFEAIDITAEDRLRGELYRTNAARESLQHSSTDIDSYLAGLDMQLLWGSFDETGLKRAVQLINKTNQFNLTTKRYTEAEVSAIMHDESGVALQFRLTDVYGDNGMISVIIAKRTPERFMLIDTWLMSCRVLGRGVEYAALNILCQRALEMECTHLIGMYRPSAKNDMVHEHYRRLGFEMSESFEDGSTHWTLALIDFVERPTHLHVHHGELCRDLTFTSN